MKQNDWIVATINNPTFDAGDFQHISDMTLDNTQLLSKDQYLKSRYIRENDLFKNDQGEFSEELFDRFYQDAAQKFAEFSTEDIVDNYEYSMWDVMRPKEGKIKDINFNLGIQQNPEHISIGVAGFNEVTRSDKSQRESAQNSKIYDPASGKFLDVSVNDISLWSNPVEFVKSLFDDPLVYATYDQDETEVDPYTGNTITHKKGEWKVNDEGEYYTERLNGRSLIGKQVVSATDYLTPENASINDYDFFDSDDIEKSVGGTIAKNIAAVLPMFIPYVSTAYSGLLVAREMSKSLPMLYGMAMGFTGQNNVDSKLLNTIAAYGQRMSGSTSDYAQQNAFSFENFGNLMSDVALQWGQQGFIANNFSKLSGGGQKAINTAYVKAQGEYIQRAQKGIEDMFTGKMSGQNLIQYIGTSNPMNIGKEMIETGKWMETAFGKAALNKYLPAAQKIAENRMRIGQDMSLVYMAIISNTDVYQSVLEKGGTPFEAAAIALGSTVGMFSVDKYLGLGEMFFNDEPARKAIRQAARHNAELLMSSAGIKKVADTETKKGIMGLIQKGIQIGKKSVSDYRSAIKDRSLGFIGKSLGEGLEEVSEELVADASKYIGELAGKLGYFSQTDYGAGENALERYAMSFLGGAAGGGLFYGVHAFQNRNNSNTKDFQNELIYLLRQGKKNEIFAEIDRLRKQGKLGSKDLSYNTTKDKNGQTIYLSADNENQSQNDYIYNTLRKTINHLDMILNENNLNLSEDELFDKMVQGEYRALALTDFLRGDSRENAKEVSYITRYQEDFQELANKIVDKEAEIQDLINSTPDASKRDATFQQKLDKLNADKQELLKQRDYLFGEGSFGYVEKMLFAIDTPLSSKFISLTYDQFIRNNTGKSVQDLTEQEKEYYSKQYENYSKNKKMGLDEAFKLFKDMQAKINPEIQNLQGVDISKEIEQFKQIAELDPFAKYLNYDSRLEGESDKDYADRYTQRPEESDQDFNARKQARQEAIAKYNQNHLSEWISQLTKHPIDRNTFRTLQARIGLLRKNVYNKIIERLQVTGNTELQHKIWNIVKTVGSDKKDRRKLYKQIRKAVSESLKEFYINQFKGRLNNDQWEGIKTDLEDLSYMDPEDKRVLGLPDNFYYDPDVPLTKGDIYSVIHAYVVQQSMKGNNMSADDIAEWLETKEWQFGDNAQGLVNKSILDFYIRVESGITSLADDEASEVVEITESYLDKYVEKESEKLFNDIKKNLTSKIFKDLETDPDLKALTDLENIAFINNPVLPILKQISQKLRNSDVNIEQFLEELYQQYQNGETAKEFQLTDAQMKTLENFRQDLEMAKAFIYAASAKSDYNHPVGHNKSINEFAANHTDVFGTTNPLPEIDEQTANFLINEANNYSKEINSWIERSKKNTADKVQKFIDSEIAFNKSRLEFYKVNRDAFKINPTLDLLDGYESFTLDDSLSSLVQLEETLHRNYKKAIKSGVTIEQILDALLPKIVKIESLKSQLTAKLDESIGYNKITDYDKLALLISNFALSSVSFYTKLKDFINNNAKIAPLAIQEYAARLAQAQQSNPQVINQVLEYLNKKLNLPILKNTTIITGVGGSGKTQAVARLSTSNGEDTWLSGPTSSQINNLLEALPKGVGKSKEELFEIILGKAEATEFLNSVVWNEDKKRWEDKTNGKFYTKTPGLDGNTTVVLKDSVKVNKITNAPKFIIIDEATHFSTAELQLLGKFAEENGINIILLGDDHQNGKIAPGLMQNMGREYILAWRAPKLFISLRDNNIQKINNLTSVISIIDQLQVTSGEEELAEATKKLLEGEFGKLTFKYFNGDQFFGEFITDSIPSDLMGKLTGEIGFIGPENDTYRRLKEAGKNVILIDPVSVQGREFDYVVVDKDWSLNIDRANLARTGINIKDFMQDLYTMISRSRKGTILIDNKLSDIVANVEDEFSGESTNIKDAIKEFRIARLKQIEQALANIKPEEPEEATPPPPPTPPPSSTIKGTKTTLEEIQDEDEPVDEGDDQDEKGESEKQEEESYLNMTTPVRVYSNVSYSGDVTQDVWQNIEDSTRDLGIFLRPGQRVSEGQDKFQLVKRLIELKSIFNYGINYYDRLHPQTKKNLFSKEAFENAQYFISVEDKSTNNNLVGLTSLDPNKRTINGKVISLIAKIVGKDGRIYTISLGGLANPETWEKNERDIRAAIQKRIDDGDEKSDELKAYLDGLHNNILAYKNKIAELSKTNQEYRINKPNFSGLTTLIDAGRNLRLENINSKFSPFDDSTAYAVKSKVYSIVDDIPGIKMTYTDSKGKERTLKGRAVMYVSSNILLKPDELEKLYMAQKQDPTMVPQVRMIVLDNQGVSFASLYRKSYQDIYTISKGDVLYTTPFKLEPMAIRMYIAAWNFRSNLKRFLQIYNEWLKDNNLDQKTVEDLCKLDNAEYSRLRGDKEYLSEEDYRSQVSDAVREKVKIIWDFNDSLADSVRQFRLGYSSKNGAYIRKLTNLKEGGFYKDINNTLGIYINPSMAIQFDRMLDALFDNIINKIIPTDQNPLQYIDTDLLEGWFQRVDRNKEISIKMYDDAGKELNVDLNIQKENALTALPSILIETAKFLSIRGINPDTFDQYLNENQDKRYFIKFDNEPINWRSLADALDGGQIQINEDVVFSEGTFPPGIRPYSTEDGVPMGVIDKRIDNMFSLMFHGMTSTSQENDFNKGDIRATDAKFKLGFFTDPILETNDGTEKSNAPVATNRKLFSANVVPGLPIIGISLEKFQETEVTVKPKQETETASTNTELKQAIEASVAVLKNSEIDLSKKALSKITSIEGLYNLVKQKINDNFDKYFDSPSSYPLEKLITSVKINGNKLEFTYFTSSPQLNGESFKYKWKDTALMITTESGKKYSVQKISGNIIWEQVSDPQSEKKTVGEVISQINKAISGLSNLIGSDEAEQIQTAIQEGFRGNQESTMASSKLILPVLNNIQEILKSLEDTSDAKWTSALNTALSNLSKLKNTNCII